ncbi:MAG: mucoidy inhibitor MuiA family protein [Archangium sp.]
MTPHLFLLLAAAVDAPVTQVTVFTNQARVVREARVPVNGTSKLEFPVLRDSIDLNSVKVEANGAEVKRVDIERVQPEALRTDDAKKLLAEYEAVEAELDRLNRERQVLTTQRDALNRLAPTVPTNEPLKPPTKLNATGWTQGAQFTSEALGRVQTKLREGERALKKANEKRNELLVKLQLLGNPETTSGWKIIAQLSGNGAATVTLTYLVMNAQWTPTWDLQLQPDTNTVSVSLAGLVSQNTGEDWQQAALALSTAIPSNAVTAPKLATWKIGVSDRFIPTPTPIHSPIAPPPPLQPLARARTEDELIRARLQRLGISRQPTPDKAVIDFESEEIDGDMVTANAFDRSGAAMKKLAPPMEQPAPAAPPPPPVQAQAMAEVAVASTGSLFSRREAAYVPTTSYSLSPPPAWAPPNFGADSPVTLAGGYDLSFTSLQKETIPSARGARRVALWSAQWPVTVERKLFPALTTDAYLVAELKNPSQQVLPGGPAQLFVGADPAGTARLQLVSPGEPFTLPLGIDRALKPVRNVQMVEATQGLISKDEVGTYTVTIELANPYRAPVAVRVFDQFPVATQKEVETKFISSSPSATKNDTKGSLEWRVTIPAQQKQVFTFSYSVKRPKNWKLQQQEVVR